MEGQWRDSGGAVEEQWRRSGVAVEEQWRSSGREVKKRRRSGREVKKWRRSGGLHCELIVFQLCVRRSRERKKQTKILKNKFHGFPHTSYFFKLRCQFTTLVKDSRLTGLLPSEGFKALWFTTLVKDSRLTGLLP